MASFRWVSSCAGLLLWALAPGAAHANTACDVVGRAMLKVGEQPGVHQKTFDGTPPRILTEAISTRDAMYLREGGEGPWRKAGFDQAKRRALAEAALKSMPLADCTGPEAGSRDGLAFQAYGFRQPDPMTPGRFTTSTIWIGSDGLPRRMILGGASYQTMEYGDFAAPTDVIEPRQRRAPR